MASAPAPPSPQDSVPPPRPAADEGGASPAWTAVDWSRFLAQELRVPVRVAYGRSRTVPVQARAASVEGGAGLDVRMHRMFEAAPPDVRDALARWLRVGRRARRAGERLDRWIQRALAETPEPTRRRSRLEPGGLFHDLGRLAAPLFSGTFAGDFPSPGDRPRLTWGRRSRSRSRRSLRLGSYELEARVVRIHPVLDQAAVPEWFVRFVLMHEILHAVHPPRLVGRRWVHHGPEFRARERAYPDYERAVSWEEKNLGRLIRAARTGRPLQGGRLASGRAEEAARGRPAVPVATSSAPPAASTGLAAPIAARQARQLGLFAE